MKKHYLLGVTVSAVSPGRTMDSQPSNTMLNISQHLESVFKIRLQRTLNSPAPVMLTVYEIRVPKCCQFAVNTYSSHSLLCTLTS